MGWGALTGAAPRTCAACVWHVNRTSVRSDASTGASSAIAARSSAPGWVLAGRLAGRPGTRLVGCPTGAVLCLPGLGAAAGAGGSAASTPQKSGAKNDSIPWPHLPGTGQGWAVSQNCLVQGRPGPLRAPPNAQLDSSPIPPTFLLHLRRAIQPLERPVDAQFGARSCPAGGCLAHGAPRATFEVHTTL